MKHFVYLNGVRLTPDIRNNGDYDFDGVHIKFDFIVRPNSTVVIDKFDDTGRLQSTTTTRVSQFLHAATLLRIT